MFEPENQKPSAVVTSGFNRTLLTEIMQFCGFKGKGIGVVPETLKAKEVVTPLNPDEISSTIL